MKQIKEIPFKKRSKTYRFFEMLTPILSFASLIAILFISFLNPFLGSVLILCYISMFFVRGLSFLYSTIVGRKKMREALCVDWHQRLLDLNKKKIFHKNKDDFQFDKHQLLIKAYDETFPQVNDIYHLVILTAYNEGYEIIEPTINALLDTTYNKKQMIICLAYEERGGKAIDKVARKLQKKFINKFADFVIIKHPRNLPKEVVGKGGNITFAGKQMSQYFKNKKIKSSNVIVTTLDCDNKPHPQYFDYVAYEFILYNDRKQLSFQPISLFINNIWESPAPIRVISTGNSFWNIICSTRPHSLRNFASHSQPLDALEEMNFWSTRTVVEDGHQFWRSYFHFNGHYHVVPIYVPIYQDAVLTKNYYKTLKAQFIQLRRWNYGVSDVPYVLINTLALRGKKNFFNALFKSLMLIESNINLPILPLIGAFGGWIPLILSRGMHNNISINQIPIITSSIQQMAIIGLLATVFFSFSLLPPRPKKYNFLKTFSMILQWFLIPITSIFYNSLTSLSAQARLLTGNYLEKFDVTEKTAIKK